MRLEQKNVDVIIVKSRWNVSIITTDRDTGIVLAYVASADSALTFGDGIWFGTEQDYLEKVD